jgi:hypothetical protein
MTAFAQYLRIFQGGTTFARWQNYYVNETVQLDNASFQFAIFEADGIESGDLQSESTLRVVFASDAGLFPLLLRSLRNAYSVEIQTYAFDPRQQGVGQILVGTYAGQIINAQRNTNQIVIELGATLSPVGSQVPPRKFTTRLVGAPCRLD